jgi:hypothetical protein
MTTDNFCFYSQNRLIQTSQTGGQGYTDTSPLVFPEKGVTSYLNGSKFESNGLDSWVNMVKVVACS